MKTPSNTRFDDPIFDRIITNVRAFVEKDEDEIKVTTFDPIFADSIEAFASFPCDSAGNPFTEELTSVGKSNLRDCLQHAAKWCVVCRPRTRVTRLCPCGSGQPASREYDGRGIFLCNVCATCREQKLSRFRREVLTSASYEADEPIEMEDY